MIASISLGFLLATQTIGRQPKPKPVADVMIMPVYAGSEVMIEDRSSLAKLVRGSTLVIFQERRFDTVSPALIEATARQLNFDSYPDPELWTKDVFSKFSLFSRTRFVCGVQILSVGSEERAPADPRMPGMTLVSTAKVKVWLYDDKEVKLVLDGVESTGEVVAGRPGPSQSQVTSQAFSAATKAVRNVLEPALKKFPVVKKKGRG
jgi:hypothetical protein